MKVKRASGYVGIAAAALLAVACGEDSDSSRVEGRYELLSNYSMPQGMPSGQSEFIDSLLDVSRDSALLSSWLLDRMEDEVPAAYYQVLRDARSREDLDDRLKDALAESHGDYIMLMEDLADDISQVMTSMKLRSDLNILIEKGFLDGAADHEMTGVIFTIDEVEYDEALPIMKLNEQRVSDVMVRVDDDETWIQVFTHGWNVPYGSIMTYAIDDIISPKLRGSADSLSELLLAVTPCAMVGRLIDDIATSGTDRIYEDACEDGVSEPARDLRRRFAGTMADLVVTGDARLVDENDDGKVDLLADGEWEGQLTFDTGSIRLRRPLQTFEGRRTGGTRFPER